VSKTCEDRIKLAGVKIYPRIGITHEERNDPQECQADLKLWGNLEAAAGSDDLNQSIDYCQVLSAVKQAAVACEYNLLETLAYRIVRTVLHDFPVNRVRIKLRKHPSILLKDLEFVEVTIEESR
jgi:dihydroneopterin aldolase